MAEEEYKHRAEELPVLSFAMKYSFTNFEKKAEEFLPNLADLITQIESEQNCD